MNTPPQASFSAERHPCVAMGSLRDCDRPASRRLPADTHASLETERLGGGHWLPGPRWPPGLLLSTPTPWTALGPAPEPPGPLLCPPPHMYNPDSVLPGQVSLTITLRTLTPASWGALVLRPAGQGRQAWVHPVSLSPPTLLLILPSPATRVEGMSGDRQSQAMAQACLPGQKSGTSPGLTAPLKLLAA